MLGLQGIHSGFGSGIGLLCLFEGMLSPLHAGAQGGAAGFQCIQRGLCLGPLRVGQGCTSGSGLLFQCIGAGILRGGGVMGKFMISTFTDLILRVVLAVVLSKTALGATGIWCAWPVGWSVATVLSVLFYKQGYWNRMEETSE